MRCFDTFTRLLVDENSILELFINKLLQKCAFIDNHHIFLYLSNEIFKLSEWISNERQLNNF